MKFGFERMTAGMGPLANVFLPFFAVGLGTVAAGWLVSNRLIPTYFSLRYKQQFIGYDPQAAVLLLVIAAFSLCWSFSDATVERVLRFISTRKGWIGLLTVLGLSWGTLFLSHNHRLSGDEVYLYFQAQLFAAGRWIGQYPPDLAGHLVGPATAIQATLNLETGRVVSSYWPGFSLLLAPLMALGVPWLLNPLLSAACLFLIFRLTKKLTPHETAPAWAVLFALASPFFMVQGISYFTGQAYLFFNLLFVLLLLEQRPSTLYLAGLAGGFALVIHNPIPHAAFALPWLIWQARQPDGIRKMLWLMAGYLTLAPAVGLGWIWIRHDILGARMSEVLTPALDGTYGWLKGRSFFPRASDPFRIVDFFKINVWSAPGLVFLALAGFNHAQSSPARVLGWSAFSTLFAYLFVVYDQTTGWAYRYFHGAWAALPVLAAIALTSEPFRLPIWRRIVFTSAVLSLVLATGLRGWQVEGFINRHLATSPCLPEDQRQVCFIKLDFKYRHDLIQNHPLLLWPRFTLLAESPEADAARARRLLGEARIARTVDGQTVWIPE